MCLLYSDTIAMLQEYNILYIDLTRVSTHYNIPTHRKQQSEKIEYLKWNVSLQQNFLHKNIKGK